MSAMQHKNLFAIEAILEARFQQGRLDDCVNILSQTINAPIRDGFRLAFLNDLGYAQLCKGDLDEAEKALTRAFALATENPDLESPLAFSGLTFFLDNEIIPYTWSDRSKVKTDLIKPIGQIDRIIDAVKVNLVTLALAKGDADEATSLAIDIIATFTAENSYVLRDLVLLFIARFRNDIKTARSAWKQYLVHKREYESIKIFKGLYPDFYKWLNPPKNRSKDKSSL